MIPQGKAATMISKAALLIFILRILVLKASLISVALVASSHYHVFGYDIHYDFKNIITLRYVMAVAATSLVYGVVQLPFAACYFLKSKRLIPHPFEFYADKVASMLLATGSGAGIAISREFKKEVGIGSRGEVDEHTLYYMDPLKKLEFMKSLTDIHSMFWNKLLAASVFLLLAWLCLFLISVISYHHHHSHLNNKNANPTLGTYHHRPPPPPRSDTLEEPSPNKEQHTHVPTTDDDVKASSHDDVRV